MAWRCKWCGEEVYEFRKGNKLDKNKNIINYEESDIELSEAIYYCHECENFSNFRIEEIAKWEED